MELTRYGSPPQLDPSPEENVSHRSRASRVDTVGYGLFFSSSLLRRVRSLMTSESWAALGGGNQATVRRYNEEGRRSLGGKETQTPPWQLGATYRPCSLQSCCSTPQLAPDLRVAKYPGNSVSHPLTPVSGPPPTPNRELFQKTHPMARR